MTYFAVKYTGKTISEEIGIVFISIIFTLY